MVYETGGLLIDGGWLRILGSGHPRLTRTLPGWNKGRTWIEGEPTPKILIVADDVLGGSFAINGGGLNGPTGHVQYFAPDRLTWERLECGYSEFLHWVLVGNIEKFYETWRWPGWRGEVSELARDKAFSIYPFLWAEGPTIEKRARKVIPMAELFGLQMDLQRQLAGGDEA